MCDSPEVGLERMAKRLKEENEKLRESLREIALNNVESHEDAITMQKIAMEAINWRVANKSPR